MKEQRSRVAVLIIDLVKEEDRTTVGRRRSGDNLTYVQEEKESAWCTIDRSQRAQDPQNAARNSTRNFCHFFEIWYDWLRVGDRFV